jgi:hypothetical protein
MRISNGEKHGITYTNSWVTGKAITEENVEELASCARTRWKIENGHNNALKNRGYNLEHNFGHRKHHAGDLFFLLNPLAFQFHTILELSAEDCRKARSSVGRREETVKQLSGTGLEEAERLLERPGLYERRIGRLLRSGWKRKRKGTSGLAC